MTRIEEAAQRLERAVGRLEAACRRFESSGGEDKQLALALSETRAEYEKLKDVAGKVASRLDGAIERLNTVLVRRSVPVAQVSVTINGRKYPVACDDGQEARIVGLAQYIDGKVADFAKRLGQIGEARLMLLAGLVLADELAEATDALRRQRRSSTLGANGPAAAAEGAMANGLDALAERVEAIAERLEKAQV